MGASPFNLTNLIASIEMSQIILKLTFTTSIQNVHPRKFLSNKTPNEEEFPLLPGIRDDPGDNLDLLVLHSARRNLEIPRPALGVIVSTSPKKASHLRSKLKRIKPRKMLLERQYSDLPKEKRASSQER